MRDRHVPAFSLTLILLLAACGSSATPAPTGAGASPGATGRGPDATASAATGPTSGSPVATLIVDEGLLRYLPEQVGGFRMDFSREAAESVAGDPSLAGDARSIAYGIAADPAGTDWVVAAVVEIDAGVFSEAWFRDWRTTYDGAACAQAGGVAGHAEAGIDGRTVYIGTCNGGSHTYHVFLDADRIMISAASVGPGRFGELLMSGLRAG